MEVVLRWQGPLVLVPQKGYTCVFEHSSAYEGGIYLWTVEQKNAEEAGYLVNYVGKATKGRLGARQRENMDWSYDGKDKKVSIPTEFAKGKRVPFASWKSPSEFRSLPNYAELLAAINENYKMYRVFVATLDVTDSILLTVESGIIRTLRRADQDVASFLSNRACQNPAQIPLTARMETSVRILGLGPAISC